jgi:hypothetical protein
MFRKMFHIGSMQVMQIIETQQTKAFKIYKKQEAKVTEKECSHFGLTKFVKPNKWRQNTSASKSTEFTYKRGTPE